VRCSIKCVQPHCGPIAWIIPSIFRPTPQLTLFNGSCTQKWSTTVNRDHAGHGLDPSVLEKAFNFEQSLLFVRFALFGLNPTIGLFAHSSPKAGLNGAPSIWAWARSPGLRTARQRVRCPRNGGSRLPSCCACARNNCQIPVSVLPAPWRRSSKPVSVYNALAGS
jgi:hypothetical protein